MGIDNSFSWDKHDVLRFGKGGVDDAEDAEVILHEYGHAMQDSQPTPFGFGSSVEAGSIGEGFGDYWAVTVSNVIAPDARPAVRRRLGFRLVHVDHAALPAPRRHGPALPGGPERRVHHDGQIWSRALWDIRKALGHVKADTIILEAHFGFAADTTMPRCGRRRPSPPPEPLRQPGRGDRPRRLRGSRDPQGQNESGGGAPRRRPSSPAPSCPAGRPVSAPRLSSASDRPPRAPAAPGRNRVPRCA